VEHADPDLFQGRTYVLTPDDLRELDTPVTSGFLNWLGRIGAKVKVLSADEHDRIVALTSHLPQMLSTALAVTVSEQIETNRHHLDVSGSGLRDMTRLALSSFDIWHDILSTNSTEIDHVLRLYIDKLQEIRQNLTNLQLREEFTVAADVARRLRR
jgi:prephenate dehydrogenase